MSLGRYTAVVISAVAVSLAALRTGLSSAMWAAVAAGAVLAAANTIAAFALVLWSTRRSNVAFFQAILGGMVVRMMALLGATVAAILSGLPRVPFATGLLAYFVAFLALELALTHRLSLAPQAGGGR
jgi:hypothetical protein